MEPLYATHEDFMQRLLKRKIEALNPPASEDAE